MLFSVIVPVYNGEKYLKACLDSISEQSFRDFECIIVNDGSTDSSARIIETFVAKDKRFRSLAIRNCGVALARLTGAQSALGEYVVCVDADDETDGDYLRSFSEEIKRNNPDIVCSGAVWKSNEGEVVKSANASAGFYERERAQKELYSYLIEDEFGVYFAPSLWAKAVKRELFLKCLISDGSADVGEDSACTKPMIYLANSISIIDFCGYIYKQNGDSVTKCGRAFNLDAPRIIGEHIAKFIPQSEADFGTQTARLVTHLLFNACCSQFNGKKSYAAVKKELKAKLSEPYYVKAVNDCVCRGGKLRLAKVALKLRLFALMKLYNGRRK